MKVIFDRETELGRCDADRLNEEYGENPGEWRAFAHTYATMTDSRHMLKIEQRCYLRPSEPAADPQPQTWVKPEMNLEPVIGSEKETMQMAQLLHEQYVQRARDEFMEASVVIVPSLDSSADACEARAVSS